MVTTHSRREKRAADRIDGLQVVFDDGRAVAGAGLILPATLAARLGLEGLVDEGVRLGDRPGAARPGRKAMTLVHAILAGASCIDDCQLLRAGEAQAVLGHRVMAPSTLGTFLRAFTFGHVRQLDRVSERALARAWAAGAGPGAGPLVIDLDSTICEVHGHKKQGAGIGYTHVRGYHPLLATRADTGEVLHVRMRKGQANTMRGAEAFVRELAGRVRRAGASGPLTIRADSGFWAGTVIGACRDHRIRFSISVRSRTAAIARAIDAIPEGDWQAIDYTAGGQAEVAEATYKDMRLIVRRTRLTGTQAQLFPDWRHHAFLTDRPGTATALDADHRAHAVIELAIRDLKAEGLAHCPSGNYSANAAWVVIAALAHNLVRWVARLGLGVRGPVVAKTLRTRLRCYHRDLFGLMGVRGSSYSPTGHEERSEKGCGVAESGGFVPPDRNANAFTCPRCGVLATQRTERFRWWQQGKQWDTGAAVSQCFSCDGLTHWVGDRMVAPPGVRKRARPRPGDAR